MFRSLRAIHCLALAGVLSSLSLAFAETAGVKQTPSPVATPCIKGPEGARAFSDLATYYRDHQKSPSVDRILRDLESTDQAVRASSGKYLLALLAQSHADETNGRGNWERNGLPAWGSSPNSDARAFRESLAEEIARGTTAAESLDAAVWLLNEDKLPDNQKRGVTLLCRIKSDRVNDVLKELLRAPHPNQATVVAVLDQVAERKLVELAPEVRRLAAHYRPAVRTAARTTAKTLAIGDLPDYQPDDAITPRIDRLLKDIATMVEGGLPAEAKWGKFTVTFEPEQPGGKPVVLTRHGWLLSEKGDTLRILNWFGSRNTLPKSRTVVEISTPAATAETLLNIRKQLSADGFGKAQDPLSPMGSFSGQFEPEFIKLPEGLVAAWLYERGDKRLAAKLLLPRIEAAEDDRWIGWTIRDMLGHLYHQEMLDAFAEDRDYERTIQLANHLSKAVFDGYPYQSRAKRLAVQLPQRADDFKSFRLPKPAEWRQLKAKLDRAQQIQYLAARLRLLNCFQWCQPGGVDYNDPQTEKPGLDAVADQMLPQWSNPFVKHPSEVVNPFTELCEMNIQVAELPTLAPFLADDNFMPTYSYWRSFHPGRTLHQVNWAVARLINRVAKHDLAQLDKFVSLDEQGRQRHIASILEWCRQNAKMSEKELLLRALTEATDWYAFQRAANEAVEKRVSGALPIFVKRFADFDRRQNDIAELCYSLDSPDAAVPARKWLSSHDEQLRFWAALILLQHGDRSKPEGLAELESILAKDTGNYWYPHAIAPLLASKNEKAVTLAYGILKKDKPCCSDIYWSPIFERLFLAGRQEGLDYVLAFLESEKPYGSIIGNYDGKEVRRSQVEGDIAALVVTSWQTGGKTFNRLLPDDVRRSQRKELRDWLKKQHALIQAGKEPDMTLLPMNRRLAKPRFDAP